MRLIKAINKFVKLAEIPDYPKCKICGSADPYLNDDKICYKCFNPASLKKDDQKAQFQGSKKDEDEQDDDSITKNWNDYSAKRLSRGVYDVPLWEIVRVGLISFIYPYDLLELFDILAVDKSIIKAENYLKQFSCISDVVRQKILDSMNNHNQDLLKVLYERCVDEPIVHTPGWSWSNKNLNSNTIQINMGFSNFIIKDAKLLIPTVNSLGELIDVGFPLAYVNYLNAMLGNDLGKMKQYLMNVK